METNKRKIPWWRIVLALIVIVVGSVATVMTFQMDEEEIVKSFVKDINKRKVDKDEYMNQRYSKEDQKFYDYYYKLIDKYECDEEITYDEQFESLESEFGEDFKINYEIIKKVKMSEFKLEVIEEELEYGTEHDEECIEELCDELREYLESYDVPEKKIEKCIELYKETFNCDYEVTEGYYIDLRFTIEGDKSMVIEKTVPFVYIDNKVYALQYIDWGEDAEVRDEYYLGGALSPRSLLKWAEDK